MRSLLRLRVLNLVGAAVFATYGVLIAAPPVWVVNGAIVLIDLYHLRGMLRRDDDYFEVLEVPIDSGYLRRFLAFHRDDIAQFQPDWSGLEPGMRAYFVLRDMVPAGLVVLHEADPATVVVDLDYAIEGYRDFRIGNWVYRQPPVVGGGHDRIVTAPGTSPHRRYLERMGFEPHGARYERRLT